MKSPIGVFFSDTHLDESTEKINLNVWKQVDDLAIMLKVPLIHAGDAFTSRKAQSLSVLNTFNNILDNLRSNLYIIPGNHDKVDLESEKSYLDSFRYHPMVNLKRKDDLLSISNKVDIWFLPYFKEEGSYSVYLKKIVSSPSFNKNKKNVLVTHISINGVKNNDSTIVTNKVDQDLFDLFDLVLIGHYHQRTELGDNMLYIGSAYQGNFGENDEKGFTILYDDLSIDFVKSDFPPYITETIDLDIISNEELIAIHTQCMMIEKGFIRFIVTGKEEKRKSFDKVRYEQDGIKVIFKDDSVEKEISQAINGHFVSFDKKNIREHFKEFSEKEKLNYNYGLTFFEQIIG